eukprot:TRINITY_DN2546_c0_g1_i1.p1 TRINITY_DN2546_c0_g1~~TRINITY_DN2546_c0_g1_i1.p1  ORF type:complete len:190 (+),score=23.06 TRINITY_DN2546_c0_g1_i1:68-571(+)
MKAFAALSIIVFPVSCVTGLRHRMTNVSAEVEKETQVDFQIHDSFQTLENEDVDKQREIEASRDFAAIQIGKVGSQRSTGGPCSAVTCGVLQCPGGFIATKLEGHCCPYCVNPKVKVEAAINGATGASGGVQSTFCPDVWCFPTLCTKPTTAPTTSNGLCCESCAAF